VRFTICATAMKITRSSHFCAMRVLLPCSSDTDLGSLARALRTSSANAANTG